MYTLRFIISFLFLVSNFCFSQKIDSIPPKIEKYGLRLGIDLFKLSRPIYENDYRGVELVGDFRISKRYFLAAEIGNEKKTTNDDRLNFTTSGSYIKIGADYNLYQNWLDMENLIYLGLRYSISSFNQQLNSYQISESGYFPENPATISGQEWRGLSAQWIEIVLGVKAEVFKNVFAGFSFRLNRLTTNNNPSNFENLYIPGYNRLYSGNIGVGFNYTISYFLPIYKKKTAIK